MEDTIKITTPEDKHEVVLKKWITGRDRRAIQSIYYDGLEIGINENSPIMKGMKGSVIDKAQDKTLEVIVVSVNGKKEGRVDAILDMKEKDFDFVLSKIEEITEKKSK